MNFFKTKEKPKERALANKMGGGSLDLKKDMKKYMKAHQFDRFDTRRIPNSHKFYY